MWRAQPIALYDVAVTALMLWPELFETQACSVAVETCDAVTMGQTRITRGQGPCRIVTGLDTQAFYGRIAQAMSFYAPSPSP